MFRCLLVALVVSLPAGVCVAADAKILFNRDIRAILSDKCFACHGPDAETLEAGLRLDIRAEAVETSGAIVPGDAATSELVRRIFSADADEVMPPPETHKPLTKAEQELLRNWIDQGAEYEPHWAYTPMRRPSQLPAAEIANATEMIDALVTARLAEEGVEPTLVANKITLIRRLSFDLTGMPPTVAEVDRFLGNSSADAYEKLVDRMLASARYGERMAVYWLDLVRYADTVGYHGDQNVSQSPYRDYVISAFNENMPYDQFVREQLAGDLLPGASLQQLVASGYNRLNQTTEEGGSQAQEYLAIYFADRVRNVSQVFMGATVGCAQCHDHKYDPYTTRDFYSLGAFFADLEEQGVYGARSRPPMIRVPDQILAERLAEFDQQIAAKESEIATLREQLLTQQGKWEAEALQQLAAPQEAEVMWVDDLAYWDKAGVLLLQEMPEQIVQAIQIADSERTSEQAKIVREHYLSEAAEMVARKGQIESLRKQRQAAYDSAPETVISKSVEPRTIRVLPRGNWMDDSGEIVEPAIPTFLGALPIEDRRATRLDLANWLCRNDNPLTARTMANRLWSLLFGRGICASVDDFGGQGSYPSYPELLDGLSLELVNSGWDIKHVIRSIVLSQTYQRSSTPSQALQSQDPYNNLFARQQRFTIDAEMVRDTALAVSGLLVEQIGGPSVRPYQPAGYYAQLNFPRRQYQADGGDAQYRRGLYTHWQRTFLHPMLKAFDAPSREECTAQRAKSNTPLQALVLLNDPTFVEAARVFAERIMIEGGETFEARLNWAYRTVVSRPPSDPVRETLMALHQQHLTHYQNDITAAEQLIATGNAAAPNELPSAELAAWTSVARVLLNLHEAITRY